MGAGLRDAMNLAWKLAGVLRGQLPGGMLDTYEAERKPHVRTLIERAKLMGIAMTAGGEAGSLARRVVAPWLPHLSPSTCPSSTSPPRRRPSAAPTSPHGRRCAAPWPAASAPTPPWPTAAASTTWPPTGSPS